MKYLDLEIKINDKLKFEFEIFRKLTLELMDINKRYYWLIVRTNQKTVGLPVLHSLLVQRLSVVYS